jgi:hypothetical protein
MGGLLRLAFGNDIPKLATWSNINPEVITLYEIIRLI